jgi:hypothetical protein
MGTTSGINFYLRSTKEVRHATVPVRCKVRQMELIVKGKAEE